MQDTITLDGRKFRGVSHSLTANQDDYLLAHVRLAGALEVLGGLDGKEQTPERRAEELLTRILLSGRKHHILAGCLTEAGKVWSREEADSNAARFAEITDFEEKRAMQSQIVQFVLGFFSSGALSSKTSPKSSNRSAKVPRTKSEAPASSGNSGR